MLKLSLTYVVTEHLSAPAVTTRRYFVDDANVRYEWSYEGPHPDPKYVRQKSKNAITRDAFALVNGILREREHLLVDRVVHRTEGHARRSAAIDLQANVDGVETRLQIDGPLPDATHPAGPETLAVDALAVYLDKFLRA